METLLNIYVNRLHAFKMTDYTLEMQATKVLYSISLYRTLLESRVPVLGVQLPGIRY
jgi:hypothetical protein